MLKMPHSVLWVYAISTATLSTFANANSCEGELFSINSGRGAPGVLFSLQEQDKTAKALSMAEFSSAAMAYDSTLKRMYYTSSPMPFEYKVDLSELDAPAEVLAQIPVQGDRFKYNRLAYYDFDTKTHHRVDGITKSVIGMTYDAQNDQLLANSYTKLYNIDKSNGNATTLMHFDGVEGGYRGDLVIKGGELYLVTSSAVYLIDRSDPQNYSMSKLSDHNLIAVTGATLAQNGDMLISRTVINDHGHQNQSELYKLNPNTGGTCLVATLPLRINDLATNIDSSVACYTQDPCALDNKITLLSNTIVNDLDHTWRTYDFGSTNFYAPAVFTSAPTFNGGHGGVNRLQNVSPTSFEVAFKEWNYLDQVHPNKESFDYMALEQGRYTMADGTVIEVGSFELDGTKHFDNISFEQAFSANPYVFLQVQTYEGGHTIATRVKDISTTGFKAAFFEQDTLNEGHTTEVVSYIAIVPSTGSTGTLETQTGAKGYSLFSANIDHNGGQIGEHFYVLAEETSKDAETAHTLETLHVLDVAGISLVQQVSSNGGDNLSIRRIQQ
ncbi:hypothetical protein [Pseudoalteromonas luteoviolacea]|uniref:H-type lectin domain-containing protein n=1 Tax=Pseudoalteromonas luteoviolacea S4054 TaxID=1129367 RepID=A0A0F6A7G7_9GAMM|nr:hypothetical protein [Pseudoalteromonas luteoviolacea]AOT07589.1 hypothetical protein S4054249_06925 [Pseudoalteromonas luteoviolacea]AOT12505.1 hypothetical protein S40542_06925 [Pseudoalteromonas luteoviolacea]AOT17419.1 hypothetical protein S4054_06925 [Pseudoalteromonas luteoviolacea]KKE81329.1 hypothetical protein N479_22600 [Pseudoalteromonas luteoviolacea S4054]KZN70662.1 hypothetical protein N481_20830 [Pseudoalteromonas luteoviolacea S4047-1]